MSGLKEFKIKTSGLSSAQRTTAVIALVYGPLFLSGCGLTTGGNNAEGVNLYQRGQYQASIQKFQQAINLNPRNADGYYNLAATYHHLGKSASDRGLLDQSETLYNQCLNLSPNHSDAHRGLAVLLAETDRSDSAFRLLEGWATRQPHVADAKIELARLHEEFGDKQAAKAHLEEALVANTTNPRAWAALARLRESEGNYQQALANYQKSYQLNDMQPHVASRISSLQSQLGSAFLNIPSGGTRIVTEPNWVPRRY